MNKRQARHRLKNKLCVCCNVKLEKSEFFNAFICPICGRKHSPLLILKHGGDLK